MNVASSMAVALAERVEKTGGPKAGLLAWRTLAGNSPAGETRARAVLAAMRCAVALRDAGALAALTGSWAHAGDEPDAAREVSALCKSLERRGLLGAATALADAEIRRRRSARGLYLKARCLELTGDVRAATAFADAATCAESEGAADIALASRVRRIEWLSRSLEGAADAAHEAAAIDVVRLAPADRIVVARALLRAPSRFVRAGAIAMLDGVASSGDMTLARRALAVCAEHADRAGDALSALEVDRLLAMFGRDVAVAAAPRARDALRSACAIARAGGGELDAALRAASRVDPSLEPQHRRAREILEGRFEAHEAGESQEASEASADKAGLVLDAFVALRDGVVSRAVRALESLAVAAERRERVPPQAWNVARLALEHDAPVVQVAALRFVAARMDDVNPDVPPRGWVEIANVLSARGQVDLADRARRAALAANERGALDALVLSLTRSGWQLARAGERARALAALREARSLASRSR